MNIRLATPQDAPILASTERLITKTPGFLVSRPHELKDESFKSMIERLSEIENGIYIVAEENGNIAGHAMLNPFPLESLAHVVHLTIVVHPDYQEKGIGKKLLSHLVEWAKDSNNVEKIELHVRSSNERAQNLYKKFGFTQEGIWSRRLKISDNEYLDDICMGLWVGK